MKIKKILPIAFVLLLALAWYSGIASIVRAPLEYNAHLKKAKQYEKEGRYQYAVEEYDAAIAYKPEKLDLYVKKMKAYKNLANFNAVLDICQYMVSNFEENTEAYLTQLNYYMDQQQYETASELAIEAFQAHPENKKIQAIYTELKSKYTELYAGYAFMGLVRNDCAVIMDENGGQGLIAGDGTIKIDPQYESISLFSDMEGAKEQLAAVKKDGQWYYMDPNGYKALVNDQNYDYLGEISEGVMVVGKEGKYGFATWDQENRLFQAQTKLDWDEAGTMYNGAAAVRKGDKWALVGTNFEPITKYQYDEIVMDEYGICSMNQAVFVREGEKYQLIDLKGKAITKAEFDGAKAFSSGNLAAVCKDGKWGFINGKGSLKIKYRYEDAESFSKLYAPVQQDGMWGYIDQDNQFVIPCQFDKAKQFSEAGTAPVQMDEIWKMIQLYIYE